MLSHSPLSPPFITSTLYSVVLNVVLSGTQQYSEVLSMLLIGSLFDTQCKIQAKSVLVLTGTQCCTQCGPQFGTQ